MVHLMFDYIRMKKQEAVESTNMQYPPKLLNIFGEVAISEEDGRNMIKQLGGDIIIVGSDRLVKDGVDGHAFCL